MKLNNFQISFLIFLSLIIFAEEKFSHLSRMKTRKQSQEDDDLFQEAYDKSSDSTSENNSNENNDSEETQDWQAIDAG